MTTELVKISSKTNEIFDVPKNIMHLSDLFNEIEEMIDEDNDVYPFLNVDSEILLIIIDFLKKRHENGKFKIDTPVISNDFNEVVDEWCVKFVDDLIIHGSPTDYRKFKKVLDASNYMMIQELVDLLCARISTIIYNKDHIEIRKEFSLLDDFSTTERKVVDKNHKWAKVVTDYD